MDLVTLIYRALYDSLATVDLAGGVLLVAIWFQTGYVALFRAIHGPDAGRDPMPAVRPVAARPAPPERAPHQPASPWDVR